jgi:hypothetical protein
MTTTINNTEETKDADGSASAGNIRRSPGRKIRQGNERDVRDVRSRVARALASIEPKTSAPWEARFLEAQENGFVPAGRINSAAGTDLCATLINCFVQPVGDSISESSTAAPASTPRCCRPPRPCAAAAASATTSPPSARSAPTSRAPSRAPPARSPTCASSTAPARPSNPPAPPRRADGRAALRPPGHRGIHPRQGCRRPDQLQHLGRRHRSLHAGRRSRRRHRTGHTAPTPSADIKAAGAYQRGDGSGSTARCARATCGSRSCAPPTTTPSRASCSSTA